MCRRALHTATSILLISTAAAVYSGVDGTREAPQTAKAYTVAGWKYDHLDITYDDPRLRDALLIWVEMSALRDGGLREEGADIRLVTITPWEWPTILGMAAPIHGADGIVEYCWVAINPIFGDQLPLGVLAHEIGHCLGLEHTTVHDQLMGPFCCGLPGDDDRAGIQAIYGPPAQPSGYRHKNIVPWVARD